MLLPTAVPGYQLHLTNMDIHGLHCMSQVMLLQSGRGFPINNPALVPKEPFGAHKTGWLPPGWLRHSPSVWKTFDINAGGWLCDLKSPVSDVKSIFEGKVNLPNFASLS